MHGKPTMASVPVAARNDKSSRSRYGASRPAQVSRSTHLQPGLLGVDAAAMLVLVSALALICYFPSCVWAVDGADFANNLFSDLGLFFSS